MAPSDGLLSSVVRARWTARGGGNPKRPVVAAPWLPTPLHAATGRGRKRLGWLCSEPWLCRLLLCERVAAALNLESVTMEAQAQGEWSWIALRVSSGERTKVLFLHHLTSRTERTGTIFTCPQLCPCPRLQDNSCSPNSELAVGLGTSEGDVKRFGSSAGNAPRECSIPSSPANRPPAFLTTRASEGPVV